MMGEGLRSVIFDTFYGFKELTNQSRHEKFYSHLTSHMILKQTEFD